MSDDKIKALLDELDAFKGRLVDLFQDAGLGKDALLRVSDAVDSASATVASNAPVQSQDLNVDLAESPEDHPAVQGHVDTPINTDDDVNGASPDAPVEHVVSGAPQDVEQPIAASNEPDPLVATDEPTVAADEPAE